MALSRKTRRTLSLACLLGAIFAGFGAFSYIMYLPTQPKDLADFQTQADASNTAIVVFTGGSLRIATGLVLLNQQKGQKLFISGVARGTEIQFLIDVYQHDPQQFACCVVIGKNATNTIGNAEETGMWLANNPYQTIILVTAAYHMPRAYWEMQSKMPDLHIITYPVFPDHVPIKRWYEYPATAWLLIQEAGKMAIRIPIYLFNWLLG